MALYGQRSVFSTSLNPLADALRQTRRSTMRKTRSVSGAGVLSGVAARPTRTKGRATMGAETAPLTGEAPGIPAPMPADVGVGPAVPFQPTVTSFTPDQISKERRRLNRRLQDLSRARAFGRITREQFMQEVKNQRNTAAQLGVI